ncbi:MAG TPA: response regulator transcription factor [Rectinemataceae bacterium]|nr:response regulator transcription factor [Rectinemataceae bacterium]
MKILIADDHKLMREGLLELIKREGGMTVVGEAENGIAAVHMACDLRPDIVLMDIEMSDLNGIEATRQIRKEAPEIKIIALSMHEDRRFVRQMFGAGASGYVLKGSAFEELAIAIRTVASGHIYTNLNLTDMLLTDYVRQLADTMAPMASPLSDREREVLQLLAEGKGNKDIAAKLSVSVTTIDSHRKHIMDKLGLHSVAELTKYAIREGVTSPE